MDKKMKQRFFAVILSALLLFSATVMAYGESGIMPLDTGCVDYTISRTGRTTAEVLVDVTFTQIVDRYSVVIYLQKKVNGTWELDYTNPEYVFFNNGSKKFDFTFFHRYSHLKEGVFYRIKCVSKDYIDDVPSIFTTYSNQF